MSGARGFIGSTIVSFLKGKGDEVVRLIRGEPPVGSRDVRWDPANGFIDKSKLEGFDAVIHLAGEQIANGRWTEKKKQEIRESRTKGTNLLAQSLAALSKPPKVLVSASAIGYYGDRGNEILTEDSSPGAGFLPEVGRVWEEAAVPALRAGIRVVHPRIGIVLGIAGGALGKMLPIFKLGIGGKIGDGRQYMSWISLDDMVGVLYHCVITETVRGPINGVAPHPVTNIEFTKILGGVLHRPTFFPLPAFGARLIFGQLADEVLLASIRVQPTKLLASGYPFRHPHLEEALRYVLRKK